MVYLRSNFYSLFLTKVAEFHFKSLFYFQEIRQGVLKRLELIVHGLAPGDLASQSRTLVRQVCLVL